MDELGTYGEAAEGLLNIATGEGLRPKLLPICRPVPMLLLRGAAATSEVPDDSLTPVGR